MKLTDIVNQKLSEYIKIIENKLRYYTEDKIKNTPQKTLAEAMMYSLSAGGKRIRPVLLMEFCRICKGDIKKALSAACGLEMIHTFSLIHDDLPAMDDDDFRRGRPSCHKAYPESIAILAGDALAILPFQIIAEDDTIDSDTKIKLIADLSKSSGMYGMTGGQVIDIENESRETVDEQNLRYMYSLKTGELIKTACRMGCIAAGADDAKILLAQEYASKLGLAFQIIDDILDVTSTTEELGKPVGSDSQQNKTTFVTIMGIDKARQEADKITSEALEILKNFDDNEFLTELTKGLLCRKK